jgi:KDO2-lipid IV(A) lauroyltransferase
MKILNIYSIYIYYFLFIIFKLIGLKFSSFLGGKLFQIIGPLFRSKKIIHSNIKRAFPNINSKMK